MGARRLSRHGKVGSVRPPAGVTRVGHPLPHTRPPSPPSTKPGRIAHAAQSIGQVKCVHELTRPIRQMARHYPLRRAGWGWQNCLGAPCCTFPDPRGNYGIRPSFTQIPVSLDGRARANFEADELLAPVRRRSGQILSDRMLLLSGRKLPYTLGQGTEKQSGHRNRAQKDSRAEVLSYWTEPKGLAEGPAFLILREIVSADPHM